MSEKIEVIKNEQEIEIELYRTDEENYVGIFMQNGNYYSCEATDCI